MEHQLKDMKVVEERIQDNEPVSEPISISEGRWPKHGLDNDVAMLTLESGWIASSTRTLQLWTLVVSGGGR